MLDLTGMAITIWKDGGWKLWRAADAAYAENDDNWLSTIRGDEIAAAVQPNDKG